MAKNVKRKAVAARPSSVLPEAAAPAAAIAPEDVQSFEAVFAITASAGACEAGDTIELTRDEFDELKALGAIKGDWADKQAA